MKCENLGKCSAFYDYTTHFVTILHKKCQLQKTDRLNQVERLQKRSETNHLAPYLRRMIDGQP